MSPSATPATQSAAAPRATNGDEARHRSQPSVISATPATQMRPPCRQVLQSAGRCRQVPRLPCVPGRPTAINRAGHQSQPSVIKAASATQMLRPSATPPTQSVGGCRQVPRLPCKVPQRHGRPMATKRATGASPEVPRLPCKVPRRHARPTATKRATGASPVS